jgi:hypothetical protein
MSTHDPYAPPSPSPPLTTSVAIPPGEFQLQPSDYAAAGRNVRWVAAFLAFLGAANAARAFGESPESRFLSIVAGMVLILVGAGTFLALKLAWSKMAAKATRSTVTIDDDAVHVRDSAGNESRTVWSTFAGHRILREHVLLILANGSGIVLPKRAWSEPDFGRLIELIRRRRSRPRARPCGSR